MLAGAAKAFSEEKDAQQEQARAILLAQQEYLMESGIAKLSAIKKGRKESQARIDKAKSFGFDSKAALALEMSGELDSVITRLTKIKEADGKDVDGQSVARMSQAILENVPPEKLAQAMEYAIDSGAAQEVTAEKLINAIFSATTPSEVGEAASMVGDISGGEGLPSIGPFGLNLLSLTETDPADDAKARDLLEGRISHLLGLKPGSLPNSDGRMIYNYENQVAAGAIVDNAFQYYLQQMREPMNQKTGVQIQSDIVNSLKNLVMGENTLESIATQYDFSMNPSDFNPNPLPEPIPSQTPSDNIPRPPSEQSDDEILDDNNLGD